MDILTGKIVTALLFLFGSLLSSVIPVLVSRRTQSLRKENSHVSTVLTLCNSLAGGIFLATCFVALFPVVHSSYAAYSASVNQSHDDRPYSEITILAGFFLVVFIEQLAHIWQASHTRNKKHINHNSHEEETLINSDTEHHHTGSQAAEGHGHSHNHIQISDDSLFHSVLMMLALGTHTLFEGMAIGLLNNLDVFVDLVVAVAIHEFCCAIALGITIGQKTLKSVYAYGLCLVFSIMMPGGIVIGLSLDTITGAVGLLTCAIIQGVATGTFFYVLFMEVVPASFSAPKPLLHAFIMFVGCLLMSVIVVYTHKHHGIHQVSGSDNSTDVMHH